MDLEDRIPVATPEGVDLQVVVAGVGTRMAAALLDFIIQVMLVSALGVLGSLASLFLGSGGGYAEAVVIVAMFLTLFGYHMLFECLNSGRTPGKAALGLRVVGVRGGPPGVMASLIRNLVRIVDFIPMFYGVGLFAVILSRRRQRVGDLAAGTVVVVERVRRRGPPPSFAPSVAPGGGLPLGATLDVSAVGPAELHALRRFLERRADLPPPARHRLAGELAARLRREVVGWAGEGDEELIEAVVAVKSDRS